MAIVKAVKRQSVRGALASFGVFLIVWVLCVFNLSDILSDGNSIFLWAFRLILMCSPVGFAVKIVGLFTTRRTGWYRLLSWSWLTTWFFFSFFGVGLWFTWLG